MIGTMRSMGKKEKIKYERYSRHIFFKDTSWIDVSVSRRRAKRPKYKTVDTHVENANPRCLI
jgi:hypothetical protein